MEDGSRASTAPFKPGPDFARKGDPPRLLPALQRRLAGSQAGLLFVLLAGLALVLPSLAVPVFSKVFVDSVLLEGRQDWLRPLLLAMGVTSLILGGLTWLQQTYLLRLETRMAVGASSRFLWHVLRLPMVFFTQRHAGDIASRITVNEEVAKLLSGELAATMLHLATLAFYAAAMRREKQCQISDVHSRRAFWRVPDEHYAASA